MPLAIEITVNILWIPLACLISAIVGFIFRSAQLNKLRGQMHRLENQMRQTDAEILSIQRENGFLQDQLKNSTAPVIPITTKESQENLPDSSARKKMLGKSTANQHS